MPRPEELSQFQNELELLDKQRSHKVELPLKNVPQVPNGIVFIKDKGEPLPLYLTNVSGVLVHTTSEEKTQELKERFRKMMLPTEPTQFGREGVSFYDHYGHGRILDAVPYPGQRPEEALAKTVVTAIRETARWGRDRLRTIWTKPTDPGSSASQK